VFSADGLEVLRLHCPLGPPAQQYRRVQRREEWHSFEGDVQHHECKQRAAQPQHQSISSRCTRQRGQGPLALAQRRALPGKLLPSAAQLRIRRALRAQSGCAAGKLSGHESARAAQPGCSLRSAAGQVLLAVYAACGRIPGGGREQRIALSNSGATAERSE